MLHQLKNALPSSWLAVVVIAVAFIVFAKPLLAQSGPFYVTKNAVDALYQRGFDNYQSGHCPGAVTYLFAYYELARVTHNPGPVFLDNVLKAVHYCEAELRHAVAVKAELEKHGSVESVTVTYVAGGKADAPGQTVRANVPFRYPPYEFQAMRVNLPSIPP